MNSFLQLLQEFESVLKKYNLANYNKLLPPLSFQEIDSYFYNLNITNKELHLLYEWKNGFDSNTRGYCGILDLGPFLSLESIKMEIHLTSKLKLWDDHFIPIISDFSGSWLLFNRKPINSRIEAIYLYSPSLSFIEPIAYYDSVYSMIETTVES